MSAVASVVGASEVFQRRLAQRIGKPGVINGTRQQQCADHRGDRDESVLVRVRLPQSGDWRATRSISPLMRRVTACGTSGDWRDVSEPRAATGQPVSAASTCAFER